MADRYRRVTTKDGRVYESYASRFVEHPDRIEFTDHSGSRPVTHFIYHANVAEDRSYESGCFFSVALLVGLSGLLAALVT